MHTYASAHSHTVYIVATVATVCTLHISVRSFGSTRTRCCCCRFDSENPYKMLDTWDQQIGEREAVMSSLVEAASLFEVSVPDYKQLRQCR